MFIYVPFEKLTVAQSELIEAHPQYHNPCEEMQPDCYGIYQGLLSQWEVEEKGKEVSFKELMEALNAVH